MKYVLRSVIFVTLIVFSAAAAIQSDQSSGSIKGRITVEGKAQPGIAVSLFKANDMSYDRRSLSTVITDADGVYHFKAIAAGRYSVSTQSLLFVGTQVDHNGQNGRLVALDAGEAIEDVNFSLVRGGVITGRVTDTDGHPVISQQVTLLRVVEQRVEFGFRAIDPQIMETDDRGIYRIYGVLPGKYLVRIGIPAYANRATPRGGRITSYVQTFHPDAEDQSKATVVEVTPGFEATGIDIKVGVLKKSYVATGRMVDAETGKPVPNIFYGIGLGDNPRAPIGGGGYRTNEKGEFRIELGAPSRVTIYPSPSGENNTVGQPLSFDLTSERVTGLEIKLRRGQTVSGAIVAEGATGPGAAKLSSLTLMVRSVTKDRTAQNSMYAKVQEDGSFTAGAIIPGKIIFNLFDPAQTVPKCWLVRVEHNGADRSQGLDVAEGESISDVRLVVSYGNGTVRGQVKVEGRALEDLSLFTDYNIFVGFRHTKVARLFAGSPLDARGRFVMEGLPDGEYELTLNPSRSIPDDEAGRDLMSRFRAVKQTVTVTSGAESTITILLDLGEKK